ncbi:hypothetical protein AAKU58_003948 [Oxalobacteraceae bacterium GrIS 1.18]
MDIDEFEKNTTPRAKRSQLEPFIEQIFELKRKGYSNLQISEWLKANKIEVTQEAVRKFIKSRTEKLGDPKTQEKVGDVKSQEVEKTAIGIKAKEVEETQELQPSDATKNTDAAEQGIKRPAPLLSNDRGIWGELTPSPVDGIVEFKQK